MKTNWIYTQLRAYNFSEQSAETLALIISLLAAIIVLVLITLVIRKVLMNLLLGWIKQNKYRWDDAFADGKVIDKLSWFIPLLIAHLTIDSLLSPEHGAYVIFKRTLEAMFVIVSVLSISAALTTAGEIYRFMNKRRADVLQGFIDAGKILTYIMGIIFMVSIFSGMSPWGIISVLGGISAVTMLIFKDTIVGFVASIQLTTTDMVRVGDWIEMGTYGADGDVISISIHTIRVQNWDKTITTIPTYALVSNSFKNWRGMSESAGRRIKRAIMIDVNSIRFCDDELLEQLSQISSLKEYLESKEQEITTYNRDQDFTPDDSGMLNGRRQTNIGVFRAYVIAYLKNNPNINQDMTFLVRQLPPTEFGLPLEIYVFSKDQRWAHYEAIQSDIFDHLLAALPIFNLRPFQSESDYRMRNQD